ncbi:MAG: hypothetical protein JRI93_05240 [Deltaproteobacteria bacterium]|nr:hypothetical protein [Deltaproteobacteria bacterium]
MNKGSDALERLAVADPELARETGRIIQLHGPVSADRMTLLVEETLWGLSQEISFGAALAKGYARLLGTGSETAVRYYRLKVRQGGAHGPTTGRMMALHLIPVLVHGNGELARRFADVFDTMCQKGTYTLKKPLEGLSALLRAGDIAAGAAYLELLNSAFSQDISYNQSLHFTYTLPTAVASLPPSKRVWQIRELTRIVAADPLMTEAFQQGWDRGLSLLPRDSLHAFIDMALEKFAVALEQGVKFISLDSSMALNRCKEMQVAVPIGQVQPALTRYVRARTGLSISIQPVSAVKGPLAGLPPGRPTGFSDTRFIYLPDEIACFSSQVENKNIYMALVKLEAGLIEFNTHAFDLEKALDRMDDLDGIHLLGIGKRGRDVLEKGSDLERFFNLFPDSIRAAGLFTVLEHGRIRQLLKRRYPGLVKRVLPLFRAEARRMQQAGEGDPLLLALYHGIALGAGEPLPGGPRETAVNAVLESIRERFKAQLQAFSTPESSARMTVFAYHQLTGMLKNDGFGAGGGKSERSVPEFPFGRHLRPDLVYNSFAGYDEISRKITAALKKRGISAYTSDVRKKLVINCGRISRADLQEAVLEKEADSGRPEDLPAGQRVDLAWLDLPELLKGTGTEVPNGGEAVGESCRYREWDHTVGDYLEDYVRVIDSRIQGCGGDFYARTLERHAGLVKRMRHAFELLKPEGLTILRQWIEGDQFDYRALLDYALDRRAGIMPSDRLYIKRVKQQRDVAVLVLVDLSRSTANKAAGSEETVLDVEKAAIVLLCEALDIVGDRFAVAGYSGTGRFGVDYIRIKDFDETVGPEIFKNINAMVARRSTRMGAAIRHATQQLEKIPARVRLLMAIGDGFPNDVGYKQGYAIADTRQAILEAVSKNIVFKGISVNMAGDPKLDELYGNLNHNVITDIAELPDKLLRIYGSMTKS